MYPIIMISSSPTSLITMYNVRRFLQESMYALLTIFFSLFTTDLTQYRVTGSSHLQMRVLVLLQRVPLGQRISYPSIANAQQSSQVAKHAQAPNGITSSIRLRLSTSLARTPGIVLSASLRQARCGNSGLTNGVSRAFCSITVRSLLAVRGCLIRLTLMAVMGKVKGIYVSWANDPPNPKIKDWNVTELKVSHHRGYRRARSLLISI